MADGMYSKKAAKYKLGPVLLSEESSAGGHTRKPQLPHRAQCGTLRSLKLQPLPEGSALQAIKGWLHISGLQAHPQILLP